MSYILEALKKADQERAAGSVPDLETAHVADRGEKKSLPGVWFIAALLLANGIFLALYLGKDDKAGTPVDVAPATIGVSPVAVVPEPLPAPPAAPAAVSLPPPAAAAVPAGLPPTPSLPADPPAVPGQIEAAALPPAPAVTAVELPVQAPAPVVRDAGADELPYWGELTLEFRQEFSPPRLDVHVYADEPARRFILVKLRKYREGERLESGALLEEIMPDGLRLSYRGTRFLVRK